MRNKPTQNELHSRICPICGDGHTKGKKWIITPNSFLPGIEDGKAICYKHYKQAYSIKIFQTKVKGDEQLLAKRRNRENKRYLEDEKYRKKILELRKIQRDENKYGQKERKRNYQKTEKGKIANRSRNKRHYEKDPEKQRKRMRVVDTKPKRQYAMIKRRATKASIPFELTLADFIEIRSKNICYYCQIPLNPTAPGLDRLDSAKGYSKDNCVPCCLRCNTIKRDYLTPEEMILFWKLNGDANPVTEIKYSLYTPNTGSKSKKRWGRLVSYAKRKNILLNLTFEGYEMLVNQPCFYCGVANTGTGYGLDKKIPNLGYTLDNSVSCCPPCNQIKGNLLTDKQMQLMISIIALLRNPNNSPSAIFI